MNRAEEIKQLASEIEKLKDKLTNLKREERLTKSCPYCGKSFRAVGRKKFCSDSCRVKNHLKKKQEA